MVTTEPLQMQPSEESHASLQLVAQEVATELNEARARVVGQRELEDQPARRAVRSPADASAKLVQLREAESLGMLDDHDRRVRDVHAHLHDGRAHENVQLSRRKRRHHVFLRGRLHAAVQQADAILRKDVVREMIGHFGRRLEVQFRGLLDERLDLSPAGSSSVGSFTRRDGEVVGFARTPGYETYEGLGWYGVIVQRPR